MRCTALMLLNSRMVRCQRPMWVPPGDVGSRITEALICVRCGDSTADWGPIESEAAVRSWDGGRTAEPSSDQQNARAGGLAQRNAVPIRGNNRHSTRSTQCRLFQVAHGALSLPRSRGRQAHRRPGDRSTGHRRSLFQGNSPHSAGQYLLHVGQKPGAFSDLYMSER